MRLMNYIAALPPARQAELLGCETEDVQHAAFARKRVVHAGLLGDPVDPVEQQQVWQAALEELPDPARAHAVYIHIPFCQTRCLYCSFYQQASRQEAEDAYLDHLLTEIARDASRPQIRDTRIDAVFIGGGTPTSLSARNAERLLIAVRQQFRLAEDCEITFEGRVHDLIPEKIEAWIRGGVNRVSLGVQSFDTTLRRRVGRLDTREEVLRRLALLKSYDVTVIVDLIYGLPGQTAALWQQDLQELTAAPIDGMDIYQLNVFPGGALERAVESGSVPACADLAGQADLYAAARQFLPVQGFERVSLCHWRRDRRERSLYNTLAKTGAVIYAFGSGAGGNVGGLSFMHQREVAAYQTAVGQAKKPLLMMAHQVEPRLQLVSDIIISSLEKGFLDFRQLCLQERRLEELAAVLDCWKKRGLMTEDLGVYRLTAAGEFWYISMTQSLLECAQIVWTPEPAVDEAAGPDTEDALLAVLRDMLPEAGAAECRRMLARIPAPVRLMLKRTSPSGLRDMVAKMPPAMWDRMVRQALN